MFFLPKNNFSPIDIKLAKWESELIVCQYKEYNNLTLDLLEVMMHKEFPEGTMMSASVGVLYSLGAFYNRIVENKKFT